MSTLPADLRNKLERTIIEARDAAEAGARAALEALAVQHHELRRKVALPGVSWDYLRFVRISPSPLTGEGRGEGDGPWRPAAGTFDGWPKTAKDIKVIDPCCGSGHFLVMTLRHMVPIWMAEESLSAFEAVDAVLRDNIHGLEIDERCCQIAAFALAFAAWTFPKLATSGKGSTLGYRKLPDLQIACSGIGPQCSAEEWIELAEQSGMPTDPKKRSEIKNGLLYLHQLFPKRRIHHYELHGTDRAQYGKRLMDRLDEALRPHKIPATDRQRLYAYISFYRTYPQIAQAVPKGLPSFDTATAMGIFRTVSGKTYSNVEKSEIVRRPGRWC